MGTALILWGMKTRSWLAASSLVASLGTAAAFAEVTRFETVSQRPFGSFAAGDFILIEAKAHGELSPKEGIPGLDRADRNARGLVEYSTRVVLVAPTDRSRANGTLIVDVPNRGNAYAFALYNAPRDEFYQSGTFEQGTGFLQDQGFTVAEVYWELGKGAELPSFVDADGKRRYAEGAGFAIFRDVAHFLSTPSSANPLGGSVKRAVATGKSQSGRFIKSFLVHGFNIVAGRPVFEGMHVIAAAAGANALMQVGAGPDSSSNAIPTFANPEAGLENEGPVSLAELVAHVEARGERPPKMVFVNSSTDYHSRRASLARTGNSGATERPIPANVRVYDVAGASHVLRPRAPATCTLSQGKLDWSPVARATLLRLVEWVASNKTPPASVLMPLEPAAADALKAPAVYPAAVIQVPQRDADGNALGGIRLPDLVAPMGTHGPLNHPPAREGMLIGAYRPFAATKQQREAAGDARASLAERYRDRDDYVSRIRASARQLVSEGFLLPEDAIVIIQAAASNASLARRRPDSPG